MIGSLLCWLGWHSMIRRVSVINNEQVKTVHHCSRCQKQIIHYVDVREQGLAKP